MYNSKNQTIIFNDKGITRFNPFIILTIILSSYIPILGVQLYFRHDDAGTLLWALEFKKFFLYAFDPRPWLNEYYKYNGVGGYYRPFESLYIMFLQNIFGPQPFYFHLINGLMMIGTIIFLYKITELLSNKIAAFLSVVIFHVCFHSILYGTYHVVVPFGYFFEIGCFYFCLKGLLGKDHKYLVYSLLFLIPATNRQTTAIILPAMILVYFISNWKGSFLNLKTKLIILFIAVLPNVLIPFSGTSSVGTILNHSTNFSDFFKFLYERYLFYGNILTQGLTGIIVLFIIFFYLIFNFIYSKKESFSRKNYLILSVLVSIVLVLIINKLSVLAIILLFILLGVYAFLDKTVRYAIVWFFVSLGCFIIIKFYHGAYLLEAAYALSIVLGMFLYQLLRALEEVFQITKFAKRNIKSLLVFGIVVLGISGVIIFKIDNTPIFSTKREAIEALINTNKNFEDMLKILKTELPQNSIVYELSEESLGTTPENRRFWTLKERAEKVKVMHIIDTEIMMKVLGRYDISFKPADTIPEKITKNSYFAACNKFERDIAEKKYPLKLIKEIKRGDTEAAIYYFRSSDNNK